MSDKSEFVGNDRLLFGIIFGVLAFWLFAQTTLNISPVMASDLGIETSVMNIAVSITALFSGIFIVVIGSLADRFGRVKMVRIGFILSIIGSLLVGFAPSGSLASVVLMAGRILQGTRLVNLDEPLGIRFARALQTGGNAQPEGHREVGDLLLFISGFWPRALRAV